MRSLFRPALEEIGLTRTHDCRLEWGDITGAVFDYDNDGRKDVYIGSTDYRGTRGLLYHQEADGTFLSAHKEGLYHNRSRCGHCRFRS